MGVAEKARRGEILDGMQGVREIRRWAQVLRAKAAVAVVRLSCWSFGVDEMCWAMAAEGRTLLAVQACRASDLEMTPVEAIVVEFMAMSKQCSYKQ